MDSSGLSANKKKSLLSFLPSPMPWPSRDAINSARPQTWQAMPFMGPVLQEMLLVACSRGSGLDPENDSHYIGLIDDEVWVQCRNIYTTRTISQTPHKALSGLLNCPLGMAFIGTLS